MEVGRPLVIEPLATGLIYPGQMVGHGLKVR
jgi:hypothetical protein